MKLQYYNICVYIEVEIDFDGSGNEKYVKIFIKGQTNSFILLLLSYYIHSFKKYIWRILKIYIYHKNHYNRGFDLNYGRISKLNGIRLVVTKPTIQWNH